MDTQKNRERIGISISLLRTKRGITIRELSEMSGVPYPNICRIENGRFSAGIDTISKIANALGARIVLIEDEKD